MDSLRREELNRAFRLNTNLLRELILVVDERLVDTLIEHASGTVADKAPQRVANKAPQTETSSDKSGESADDNVKAEPAATAAAELK